MLAVVMALAQDVSHVVVVVVVVEVAKDACNFVLRVDVQSLAWPGR